MEKLGLPVPAPPDTKRSGATASSGWPNRCLPGQAKVVDQARYAQGVFWPGGYGGGLSGGAFKSDGDNIYQYMRKSFLHCDIIC
jgi:hypothetical protein